MADQPEIDVPYLSAPSNLQTAIIGPCVAGYQAQVLLCGILLQQYISFRNNSETKAHSNLTKYTCLVVVVLNVAYTALCFDDGYTLATSSDRTLDTLATGTIQSQFLPLLNGLLAACTESFLTLRAGAFFLNKKAKWAFYAWQSALILLVLFGSIASCAVGVVSFYRPMSPDVIPYNTVVSIWLWASAIADCSVSLGLAYNLRKRIAHFNEKTDSVLRKLMLIGLRTAAFTALLGLAGAIISSIYSGSDASKVAIAISFWIPTGALYGISLFTTLSSTRQVVEERLGSSLSANTKPPRRSQALVATSTLLRIPSQNGRAQTVPLEINVHQEIVRDIDVDEEKSDFESSFERRGRGPPIV